MLAQEKSFRICECRTFDHDTHWVSVKHGNQYWSQKCKPTFPTNNCPKSTVIEFNESSELGTDRISKFCMNHKKLCRKDLW